MSAMKAIAPCLAQYTTVFMRLALGSTFLAAVTDRCGLWGPPGTRNVAWGNFDTFLAYAAQLNPYLPTTWIPAVGWGVTLAEAACGLALIVGFQTRKVAVGSGLLLLAFALGMIMGVGVKAPFNSSVFSAAAGAFLLATRSHDPVSIDRWRDRHTRNRMVVQEGQSLPHRPQEERDMAAYIIGLRRSEPRGTAWREAYLPKTAALIAKHGGKVLIGGNAPQALMALEGEAKPPRAIVIVEFPSRARAHAFHNDPDYAPLQQLRQANIDLEVFVVEPG